MLIKISGVKKIYEVGIQKIEAVAGIDLEIERNEYVAIMGPSGSGKSTLMNLLQNVELPLIYGGFPADERRRRAAEVLESVGLTSTRPATR
jgi:ABC-type lipoprotein export system ATPase subunit